MRYLLLLSSFCVSVLAGHSMQEGMVVHSHVKFLHGLEVRLVIKKKYICHIEQHNL